MVRKGVFPINATARHILYARKEQLEARRVGDAALEEIWSKAIDRLLSTYIEDLKNANS